MAENNLEKILDTDEAAAALRMTRRRLIAVAKKHGLCLAYGRKLMFTQSHMSRILEALQPLPSQPTSELAQKVAGSPIRPEQAFDRALARVTARNRNEDEAIKKRREERKKEREIVLREKEAKKQRAKLARAQKRRQAMATEERS